MSQQRLGVIIASTRPGRVGEQVAEWFAAAARRHGGFEVDVLDLAAIDLPFLDEPEHPAQQAYTHGHTWRWSARVAACDAFSIVMPEYNFGFNAPLKNALDFLYTEWHYKPVGFVSYGGISGGTRAVQMIKQVVTTLRMVPIGDAVALPFVKTMLDDEGTFRPPEMASASAEAVLDELARMAAVLAPMRGQLRASA